jgi:hypothetical protein
MSDYWKSIDWPHRTKFVQGISYKQLIKIYCQLASSYSFKSVTDVVKTKLECLFLACGRDPLLKTIYVRNLRMFVIS